MKKLVLAALAATVVASGVFAAFAGAGAGVKAPKDCSKPVNRPHRIVLACGDFSLFVNTIHWNVWKSDKALGHGVFQRNNCKPDCASGTFKQYPANIKLKRVRERKCGGKKVDMFTIARLKFPDKQPPHPEFYAKNKLFCV